MTEIEKLVNKTEKELLNLYLRANTKSKRRAIARDLSWFSGMCRDRFDITREFEWEKDQELLSLIKDERIAFLQNVIEANASQYNDIFSSALNCFIEGDFQPYRYYQQSYSRLTQEEMNELICAFLASYDYKMLDVFEKKVANTEIFYGGLDVGKGGETYPISCLNRNYIFYTPIFGENIFCASIIAHELGHDYEMSSFYSIGRKDYLGIVCSGPYYEVTSSFFQYAFIMFLKENNVLSHDVDMLLHNFMYNLLMRTYDINLLYKMDEITIDELGNIPIEDEGVSKFAKELQEKINYYSWASDVGDIIRYDSDFIYGIGSIFAIQLYESYKGDPNNFKKEFRNAILTYPYTHSIDAFERVGITKDTLVEGSALRRVLRNNK